MRKLALTILACGAAAIPAAAWAQETAAPTSVDDFVCAFSGECAEEEEIEEDADATGENTGPRPRISATRGFALSGTSSSATSGSRAAANTNRRAPSANTNRRAGQRAAQTGRRTVQPAAQRPAGPGQRVNLRLNFELGSATLTPEARAQAQIFAQSLQRPQLANMRFLIEGHTDALGGRASNVDLSQRRAQSVVDFLVAHGVSRDRLVVRGHGPDRPLPGTRTTAPENRRVEAVRIS